MQSILLYRILGHKTCFNTMRFTHLPKSVLHCFGFWCTRKKMLTPGSGSNTQVEREETQRKGKKDDGFIRSNPKKHLRIERLTLQCIDPFFRARERESECLDPKECWPRRQHVANVMRIFGEKHGWSVTWRARKGERSQSCGAYKKRNSDPAAELPEQVEVGQEERKLEKDSFTNLVI